MIIRNYTSEYYVKDEVALKYMKEYLGVAEDVTEPNQVCNENSEMRSMILEGVQEKVDITSRNNTVLELIIKAEENGLLFKGQYGPAMSPKKFAECYADEYVTSSFDIVEYSSLRGELAIAERLLAEKIAVLDASKNDKYLPGEKIELKYKTKHIKPDFNFTGWYDRLQTIKEECWGYDADFWGGSDRDVDYGAELNSLIVAIEAQKNGEDTVVLETYGRDIHMYTFLVSELLSQERINLHYADFEELKRDNPESFEKYITEEARYNALYNYLIENHTA